jgi:hypothetical protein
VMRKFRAFGTTAGLSADQPHLFHLLRVAHHAMSTTAELMHGRFFFVLGYFLRLYYIRLLYLNVYGHSCPCGFRRA